ncbi:hypothetical protein [Nocardioides renjunii]|uniref:hypothetical protein n=1 Tax=Nocardioides renjunii TaxID=3095075 RepID=UPI002B000AEE|nr:hypothetical protein [Nocardioides sp. S-34]WQQ23476.1 hypothetical protein SHK17_05700 [Nocardioides sp. S-34]
MHLLRLLSAPALVGVAASLVTPSPGAVAAVEDAWRPLQDAGGATVAVALEDGTTALLSVGGPDDATIFDQRRTADGTLLPPTLVASVERAKSCRPAEAVTARGSFAVAVECRTKTGEDDPPATLVELVWTQDDGWVTRVEPEAELGSLDYSAGGQYVAFATNSEYGEPHHVTSYHPDLGWRDLTRDELGLTGDDIVAAISDSGNVVAVRGAGFEDEPGYWFGGRLVVETYDDAAGTWTRRLDRSHPDGGIDPLAVDLVGRRFTATIVRSRSTGELDGLDDRVVVLSGRPGDPRSSSASRWSRWVLTGSAATTRAGVAVASWHAVDRRGTAKPWLATWAPKRPRPSVTDLRWRTTLTDGAIFGRAMDVSVSANGRGALAYVRHPREDSSWTVAGESFRVARDGRLTDRVPATWARPADTIVTSVASARTASITLGGMVGSEFPTLETSYSTLP